MSTEPELGQKIFRNPTGDFGTPEYADALIEALFSEIDRVYWNTNQESWERYTDPKMKGVEVRNYCWDDDSEETKKPNLKFSHSPQEIRWYKYPGRGQSCTVKMDEKEWVEWFGNAMKIIRKSDKHLI